MIALLYKIVEICIFALLLTVNLSQSLGGAEVATEEAPMPAPKGWLQNAARKAPLGRYMLVPFYAALLARFMAKVAHLQSDESQDATLLSGLLLH